MGTAVRFETPPFSNPRTTSSVRGRPVIYPPPRKDKIQLEIASICALALTHWEKTNHSRPSALWMGRRGCRCRWLASGGVGGFFCAREDVGLDRAELRLVDEVFKRGHAAVFSSAVEHDR